MRADIAAIVGAVGVLLLLAPIPGLGAWTRRIAGLALIAGSWVAFAVGLAPDAMRDGLSERAGDPLGAAALVIGALVALALVGGAAHLLDRWPLVWFILLALALPFRVPIDIGDGETARLLVPLYLVILIGLVIVLGRLARGRAREPLDPGLWPAVAVAAFVAWLVASAAWSSDAEESAVKAIFFYLPFSVLWFLVLALWQRGALSRIAVTTIAMAVPVAVLALYQYAFQEIWWNSTLQQANVYSRLYRVNGIFFDPNILGRWLALALVGMFALALWNARPRDVWVLSAGAVVLFAGLVVTFSRSSALMLMAALAILAWRAFGPRATAVALSAIVLVGAVGGFAASGQIRRAATDLDRLEQVSEGRFGLIRGGLDIWREHPVRGAGLGAFADRFSESLDDRSRRRTRVVISHNTPVTVLAEGGIIGGVLLALLSAALAVRLVVVTRGPGRDRWFAYAGLAVLAGMFLHAIFYSGLFEDPYAWVIAAGALALIGVPEEAEEPAA